MINTRSIIQPKGFLRKILIFYAVVKALFAIMHCGTLRTIPIQNRQEHGNLIINNVKHIVRYRIDEIGIPVHVDNIIDYLFISDTEYDECFASNIIKLAIAVLLIIVSFNGSDPDNSQTQFLKKSIFYLFFALICSEIFKYGATSNWINNANHGLGNYQYENNFNLFTNSYLIPLIVIFSLMRYQNTTANETVAA